MNILVLGPENRNSRIIQTLIDCGHNVKNTEEIINIKILLSWKIEFIISNGYAPIISVEVVSEYNEKIVNIHPAYLPEGRGIYPNFWSYFECYKSGVTIHYIDSGIDTGSILLRKEIYINKSETLRESNDKLLEAAELLFINHVDEIINGVIKAKHQSREENDSFYHNRAISENYVELLTDIWDTKVEVCEELGRDFFISSQLIEKYINETTK
jgi:folate-dependent phosphoribosylglycinamide formyltransferase PurN